MSNLLFTKADPLAHGVVLKKLVGKGYYGSVYKGEYLPEGGEKMEEVAVKIAKIKYIESDQRQSTENVTKEIFDGATSQFLLEKGCPTPRVYKIFYFKGHIYTVMDFVEGQTLDKFVTDKTSVEDKIKLTGHILEGYACMHRHRVYHRDIKSDNIIATTPDSIRIIDFGLSCVEDFGDFTEKHFPPDVAKLLKIYACRKKEGFGIGAVLYSPPEQFMIGPMGGFVPLNKIGDAAKELRDSFAVGCMLFEMWELNGGEVKDAFSRGVETEEQLKTYYRDVLRGEVDAPKLLNKEIPPKIANLIERLMDYNFTQRITVQEAVDLWTGKANSEAASSSAASSSKVKVEKMSLIILLLGDTSTQPIRTVSRLLEETPEVNTTDDEDVISETYKLERETCTCILNVEQLPFNELDWNETIDDESDISDAVVLMADNFDQAQTLNIIEVGKKIDPDTPAYLVDTTENLYVEELGRLSGLVYVPYSEDFIDKIAGHAFEHKVKRLQKQRQSRRR